jgi:DNA-binding MarR family transcriptional regulator
VSDAATVDSSRAHEIEEARAALRLWLRLLGCAQLIERELKRRLRAEFDATLPRFDLMAQLAREPAGLSMGELSRRLMVSNGNVTGIAERLGREGLIAREPAPGDRRTQLLRLTPEGAAAFVAMAEVHAGWVRELLAGLDEKERAALWRLLGGAKESVRRAIERGRQP